MDRSTRRTAVLVAAAVVITFLLCRTAPLAARTQAGPSSWVKVGYYFINGNSINHVVDRGPILDVYLGDGDNAHAIHLQGADVEPMRRWLNVRADHPGVGEAPPSAPAPR
ncbi:hypothetical protein EP7_000546 [Isosphaeraceae bacterium EP7]